MFEFVKLSERCSAHGEYIPVPYLVFFHCFVPDCSQETEQGLCGFIYHCVLVPDSEEICWFFYCVYMDEKNGNILIFSLELSRI